MTQVVRVNLIPIWCNVFLSRKETLVAFLVGPHSRRKVGQLAKTNQRTQYESLRSLFNFFFCRILKVFYPNILTRLVFLASKAAKTRDTPFISV